MALRVYGDFRQSLMPPGIQRSDSAKICGIFFGKNAPQKNEDALRKKINNSTQGLETLYNTLYGRAQIVNIFILSKLWFVATISPLNQDFLQWVEKNIF